MKYLLALAAGALLATVTTSAQAQAPEQRASAIDSAAWQAYDQGRQAALLAQELHARPPHAGSRYLEAAVWELSARRFQDAADWLGQADVLHRRALYAERVRRLNHKANRRYHLRRHE